MSRAPSERRSGCPTGRRAPAAATPRPRTAGGARGGFASPFAFSAMPPAAAERAERGGKGKKCMKLKGKGKGKGKEGKKGKGKRSCGRYNLSTTQAKELFLGPDWAD